MPTKTHNLLDETILSLPEAARLIPPLRLGRRVTHSAVWRWATRGIKLVDGTRLKLEVLKVASRWITSREAIQRFCQRQTENGLRNG